MQETGPVHRPRAFVYKGAVLPALTEFWHLSDRLCGKRLVPFLGIHSEYGSEFMNNHQGPLPSARAHHQGTVTSIQEE